MSLDALSPDPSVDAEIQPSAEQTDATVATQTLEEFADATTVAKPKREQPEQKPERHRAKSQQASPDDVKAIGELTKRAKEAEAKAFADITQNQGESDRVFNLRRRAEIAERVAAGVAAPKVQQQTPAAPVRPVVASTAKIPAVKSAADDPEPDPTAFTGDDGLVKWMGAHARWAAREELRLARAEQDNLTAEETQRSEQARIAASWQERTTAAKGRYPDFEQVAYGPTQIPKGSLVDAWILEHKSGADVLYHLQKHPQELAAMLAQPLLDQVESLTLLGQRLSTRTPAVTTGAAAAIRTKPVPRLPTPVQTGPMRTNDDAPPDPDSLTLEAFEETYGSHRSH